MSAENHYTVWTYTGLKYFDGDIPKVADTANEKNMDPIMQEEKVYMNDSYHQKQILIVTPKISF